MSFEWLVPYLLVGALVFLMPKLFGMIGKKKPQSTFVPNHIYVAAGIVLAGMVLYFVVKIIAAVVGG